MAKPRCAEKQLEVCRWFINEGVPPKFQCCMRLSEQRHCLCGYMTKPVFKSYISSPNGHKFFDICRIPFPRC
ncbi:hypothetical protein EUTSA_v10019407mg [Eutrema salsugineum]|uniref:Bifunctional inhibitor/plant lipid transfer protein/seed storage helical domain-containing protein n=1 Tax=Eutrema salsugineum TaxID=72664 RepID=V4MBZ3_EUTSA|nr:hypothetical protein EUTSA_v10019407mg [Eutrema salsugineum]